MSDWSVFFISAAFVVGGGISIGRVSGALGARLGLSRAWSGAVLLSFATTLPEIVTTATVCARGSYGLALGGIMGSIIFNLFILVLVDLADPEPLYNRLSKNHLATGLLGAALLGALTTGLATGVARESGLITLAPSVFLAFPAAILILYLVGQLTLFGISRQSFERDGSSDELPRLSLSSLTAIYAGIAGVIVVAAHSLGVVVDRLAERHGLGATFAGATMLGIVTSLPEITNALACARRREYDLAVGNILGANSLVIAVLALIALFTSNGVFLSTPTVDAVSTLTMAGLAGLMQAVALGAMAVESRQHVWRVSVASAALAGLYAANLYLSYRFGR